MSALRSASAGLALLLAAASAAAARDLHAWESSLERGRSYEALLPGDPVGDLIGAEDELRDRRAVQAFTTALRTPRGFDNGERRARARSAAVALLSQVATGPSAARAARAQNLIGVLVAEPGGSTSRALTAFETAIRTDAAQVEPKYNLELLLRREPTVGTREGPDNGSGPRGSSRRGAGSGTPGRGY